MKQPRNSDEMLEWPDDEPVLDLVQALERLSLSESLNPYQEHENEDQ